MKSLDAYKVEPLLYIWGHSHEFCTQEDWNMMERILEKVSGNDKIWYVTSMEIYQYMTAQGTLLITADEKCIYNPTATTVWVEKDKKEIICILAGDTVYLG